MQYLMELTDNLSVSNLIVFIAAIYFLVSLGKKCYKGIIAFYESSRQKNLILVEAVEDIKEIKESHSTLSTTVDKILKKQEELEEKQEKLEDKNNAHNVNKIRERLIQSYRYYTNVNNNPQLAWSEMEQESWYNLFHDYEQMGGNGFMHSTVEPAMASLDVVRMNDTQNLTALMNSRKG